MRSNYSSILFSFIYNVSTVGPVIVLKTPFKPPINDASVKSIDILLNFSGIASYSWIPIPSVKL